MAAPVSRGARAAVLRVVRSRRFRVGARVVVGVGVLVAVVARVGAGPFLRGLTSLDVSAVVAALVLAFVATLAAAWRWRVVAGNLGVGLRMSSAIGLYYQSQFLNTVLPGGVVGDVHRAVLHGRSAENLARSSRAVAIERVAGQFVQFAVALPVLAVIGAEFEGYLLAAVLSVTGVVVFGVLVAAASSSRFRGAVVREGRELRAGLGSVRSSAQVVVASVVVVGCHVTTFAIAIRTLGTAVPAPTMVALALVILLGSAIPLNIGGWGPREGIAGWAFAVAGLGAGVGVAASTLFGVLAMIAVAPGAVVAVVVAVRRRRAAAAPAMPERERAPEPERQAASRPARRSAPVLTITNQGQQS